MMLTYPQLRKHSPSFTHHKYESAESTLLSAWTFRFFNLTLGFVPYLFNMILLNAVIHPITVGYIFWRKVEMSVGDMKEEDVDEVIEGVKTVRVKCDVC